MNQLQDELEQMQRLYDELKEVWEEETNGAKPLNDARNDGFYHSNKRRFQFQAARGKKSLQSNKRYFYSRESTAFT